MQTQLYTQPNVTALIIYFAGWGTSPELVRHYPLPKNCDLLLCWDYRTLDFQFDFSSYSQIHLVAWSMGVWAAEQVLPDLPFANAVAINGTPLPMNDEFGIPDAIFKGTLEQLTPATHQKFTRRICGSGELLAQYQATPSPEFEQVYAELAAIYSQLPHSKPPHIRWQKAIIGSKDQIFPAKNQQAYWLQNSVKIYPVVAPHFLFPLFESWQALWQ